MQDIGLYWFHSPRVHTGQTVDRLLKSILKFQSQMCLRKNEISSVYCCALIVVMEGKHISLCSFNSICLEGNAVQ